MTERRHIRQRAPAHSAYCNPNNKLALQSEPRRRTAISFGRRKGEGHDQALSRMRGVSGRRHEMARPRQAEAVNHSSLRYKRATMPLAASGRQNDDRHGHTLMRGMAGEITLWRSHDEPGAALTASTTINEPRCRVATPSCERRTTAGAVSRTKDRGSGILLRRAEVAYIPHATR